MKLINLMTKFRDDTPLTLIWTLLQIPAVYFRIRNGAKGCFGPSFWRRSNGTGNAIRVFAARDAASFVFNQHKAAQMFTTIGSAFVKYDYEIYDRKERNRTPVRPRRCNCNGDNHAEAQSEKSTGREDERVRFQLLREIQARNRAGAFPSTKRPNKCFDPNVKSVALSDPDFVGSE